MANNKEKETPIIIIKKKGKGGHGGGHGGSWKVAFADFATAMMAFFLVLWLMANTTPAEKKAIAAYFTKADSFQAISSHGSPSVITAADPSSLSTGASDTVQDQQLLYESTDQMSDLKASLEDQINNSESFASYRDNIVMDMTPEGLRIQILDNANEPMFENGSADLLDYVDDILKKMAPALDAMGSPLSLEGYTDAQAFSSRRFFSNWELSSERANAARRALLRGGFRESLIAQVVGRASTVLFDPKHPDSAKNRRISILVLNKSAEQTLIKDEKEPKGIMPDISPPPPMPQAIDLPKP